MKDFALESGANPAKMSLTNCRFYEEKYPEVDSYVMVNVKQVSLWRMVRAREFRDKKV